MLIALEAPHVRSPTPCATSNRGSCGNSQKVMRPQHCVHVKATRLRKAGGHRKGADMPIRLSALAGLAGELSHMTVTWGGLLVQLPASRVRMTYYEDHF